MTKLEYEQFKAQVADFFKREGLNCLSDTIRETEDSLREYCNEPFFSWTSCDVCGRPDGGMRVDMIGYNPTTNEVQGGYRVCEDCQYYVEYGQLDDMTMLSIEQDQSQTVTF